MYEVKRSLSAHPRIEKKLLDLLERNKKKVKAEKRDKKSQKKPQKEVESKQATEVKQKEIPRKKSIGKSDNNISFVIDASITGTEKLEEVLSEILATGAKIILTSVTIKELEAIQQHRDISAIDARHIMAMAVENHNSFEAVLIDESLKTPDDCIIKYCSDNKERVVLVTSDKGMALNARMYGVQTRYLKKSRECVTISSIRKIGNKIYISVFSNENKSMLLISEGIEYTDGMYELKTGDDVYIATKKYDYMTFAHYKVRHLTEKNNCDLIFSRRIYDEKGVIELPQAGYKSFMRNFKRKKDIIT